MKVGVVGLGYVGSVVTVKLLEQGHDLVCYDSDSSKTTSFARGQVPVFERGLQELYQQTIDSKTGSLSTASDLGSLSECDVIYLCIGTPNLLSGALDTSGLLEASRLYAEMKIGRKKQLFVIRSTVSPGTAHEIRAIFKHQPEVSIVSNPEFLREGSALQDWDSPVVIVVGREPGVDLSPLEQLYSQVQGDWVKTSHEVAEIIKYVNNSWHALKVGFANEIGRICEGHGIDHRAVMDIFLADDKLNVSKAYLRPGMPFGGSCLAKDLSGLEYLARTNDIEVPILSSIAASNDIHLLDVARQVQRLEVSSIGIWGLAFKNGTNDLRNAPALKLAQILGKMGIRVYGYDKILSQKSNFEHYFHLLSSHLTLVRTHGALLQADGIFMSNRLSKEEHEFVVGSGKPYYDGSSFVKGKSVAPLNLNCVGQL